MRDELKRTHGKNGIPELEAVDPENRPFHRPDLSPAERAKEFSRLQGKVKVWMRSNLDTYRDECGDVNLTALAEGAAAEFEINDEGGPLDDPDSWIWDLAVKVSEI